MKHSKQIITGITITSSGQANVAPELAEPLFDLALMLEEPTGLPVDVEHVLAAIVLAANQGELNSDAVLTTRDPTLVKILERHVNTIFADYDGRVGRDD
ncbi:MAG: hypothetical protein K0U86_04915 [Planctomycetes bacterium]|nr:hypothetical protein [Planctomycetota bacterium]MCH9724230.1 hypothetical protein [Planctomycetota bacterium]MCH9778941.1 hypothetical protein [Planctomycetota bacterium]MCH9792961.1 hypothetical protein [Planctomycetota bacterium]MDF1744834.1 hypothetical protein [Gimesia sp.]